MRDETLEKAASVWRRYLSVTEDMMRFLDNEDIDMFIELVQQRDGLIEQMQALPANDYRQSEECQAILAKLKPLDMRIIYRAKTWLNKARHQTSAVRSYDLRTYGGGNVGGIVNKSY